MYVLSSHSDLLVGRILLLEFTFCGGADGAVSVDSVVGRGTTGGVSAPLAGVSVGVSTVGGVLSSGWESAIVSLVIMVGFIDEM
jgi:hypothetical protein